MSNSEIIRKLEKEIAAYKKKLEQSENLVDTLERRIDSQTSLVQSLNTTKLELKKYSEVVTHGPASVIITDSESVIEYANERFLELTGYTTDEIIGKTPRILKSGEVSPKVYTEMWDTILSGKQWKGELINKKKNGELYWAEVSISSIHNEGGEIANFVAVSHDITALKEKETISKVFMYAADPIVLVDLDGTVIDVNGEAERSYGWKRKQLTGKSIKTIIPKEKHDQAIELIERCKSGKEVSNIEGQRFTKDGKTFPVLITLSLLKDKYNNPIAISSFAKDISLQKKAIENLRKVSQVFMEAADPMIIEDADGNVIDLNIEAERSYGWLREELIGQPIKTLVPPECHMQADELLKRCLTGESVRNVEGLRWTKEGKIIPVLITLSILKDVYNNVIGISSIASDITDLKAAEQKLKEYQDNLEKMVEDKTQELQAANEKLQFTQYTVENAGDSVFWIDIERPRFLYVNETACKKLRYSKKQLLKMELPDIDPNFPYEAWSPTVEKLKTGKLMVFESRQVRKDGHIFPVEITAQFIEYNDSGRIVAYVKDITDRKKAELKLKESEKKANEIFEFAPDGMVIINQLADILKVNKQVKEMLGYTKKEMIGQKIEMLVPEEIREKHVGYRNGYLDDPVARARGAQLELTAQCKDGKMMPVDIGLSSIDLEEGSITLASMRDITDRKEKEQFSELNSVIGEILIKKMPMKEKLQACSEAFVNIMNAAFVRIWTVDSEERLLNLQASAGLYTHIDGKRKTVKIGRKKIGKIAASKKPYINENIIEDPLLDEKEWAKEKGLVAFCGYPMLVDEKNVGVLALFYGKEISSYYLESFPAVANSIGVALMRDRAEEKLQLAKLAADQANQAKSVFLANMSHDIRTPMNAVLGFSEILHSMVTDPQQKEYLASIRSSGKSLLTLINDILDLSKVEAGKLELEYGAVNIRNVFKEMKQMFSHKVQEKGIDFQLEIDDEIPGAVILDENRLRQVMINLIGNAVKFTDEGYVKIKAFASVEHGDTSSLDIHISVIDTGIGIPDDQKGKIFEAFEQTEGQSEAKYGGTGLGLAITKKLITMMNGEVDVTGVFGEGSSFNAHFKRVAVAAVTEEDTYDTTMIDVNRVKFDKALILVVDDIESNRKLVHGYLGPYGFEMIDAENGQEMVDLTRIHCPDLVLADMKMPVMNGYEATSILKSDETTKDIPVVALTASVMMKEEDDVKEICDGYLKKPVSKTQILTELSKYLKHTKDEVTAEEEAHGEVEVSQEIEDGSAENLPELLTKLKEVFEPEWQELKDTLTITDIEEFAQRISESAREFQYGRLLNWGTTLENQAGMFDIESMTVTLQEFPEILKEIEGKI